MFFNELFESDAVMTTLVIYPGRFQPWHKGHKAVYDYLVKNFGRDNVFVASSNKVDPPRSPFNFSEKVQFMNLTGVSSDRIIETRDPYKALEVVQSYDPKNTRLIFAVSEKDMAEDPRFSFKTKKDGSPSYFQPMPKEMSDMVALQQHGYIMTVPTFDFSVLGQPMRSATEVRAQFAGADEETQRQIVKDLFGSYDKGVHDIMRNGLALAEEAAAFAVGTVLNLTKNYGNFNTLHGIIKAVTPSGKLKIQITKAEPMPGKKGAVKVGDVVTVAQNYVKRNALTELKFPGSDDGERYEDYYPCYDCGSTILGHHTRLCELAEDWAIRDLPSLPNSQHWTGEIPKGLKPIPGLENRGPTSEATDPKFLGFMNKALGDKVDPAKPATNMPPEYSNFEIMSFDNMPGYRPALKFGMSVLQAMDQNTRQHFINSPDDDLFVYMLNIATKKRFMPKYFVEEDLDEVTQWFDEIFHDPTLESWTDLLKSMVGKPGGIAERVNEVFNTRAVGTWDTPVRWMGMEKFVFTASNGIKYRLDFLDPGIGPEEMGPESFSFHLGMDDSVWDKVYDGAKFVEFEQVNLKDPYGQGKQGTEGTGAAAEVFGIVVNAILTYIKKHKPSMLYFQAVQPNRRRLYTSMINRLLKVLPEWGFERSGPADSMFAIYNTRLLKQPVAKKVNEFAPTVPTGPKGPKDYGQPNSSRYLGGYKFVLGTTHNYILTAEVQKYGLEWDEDDNIWFLDSPGAVYIADATEGEIALPPAREQRYQIHDLVTDYLNARNSADLQRVAAYFGHSADGEMSEALDEFAPPGSNNEPNEEEILRKLAAQWWYGTEQEMIRAQKSLTAMGWEIGQDESGDDDAGVFVIQPGDVNGDTYMAFGQAELEQVYRGLHEDAAGVGVIASKKQKNDPRYKTSLTVDVHPDTPKKNMRALGLI